MKYTFLLLFIETLGLSFTKNEFNNVLTVPKNTRISRDAKDLFTVCADMSILRGG